MRSKAERIAFSKIWVQKTTAGTMSKPRKGRDQGVGLYSRVNWGSAQPPLSQLVTIGIVGRIVGIYTYSTII